MANTLSSCVCKCGNVNCKCKGQLKQATEAKTLASTSSALPSATTTVTDVASVITGCQEAVPSSTSYHHHQSKCTRQSNGEEKANSPKSYGFNANDIAAVANEENSSSTISSAPVGSNASSSSTASRGDAIDSRYGSKIFAFCDDIGEYELAKYLKMDKAKQKKKNKSKDSTHYASKAGTDTTKKPKSSDSMQQKKTGSVGNSSSNSTHGSRKSFSNHRQSSKRSAVAVARSSSLPREVKAASSYGGSSTSKPSIRSASVGRNGNHNHNNITSDTNGVTSGQSQSSKSVSSSSSSHHSKSGF